MPQFFPGETIADRYRVVRELGSGGFGEVYEALDAGLGRHVAVKVLRPDAGAAYQPATRARFEREARAVGKLQSPHTVKLHDFGEDAGKLYMVFELVPGEDLRTIINRRGRLEPHEAVHILRQLLDSLGEAHRAGILHRDIKPANIRVFEWGDNPVFVKLLDFGLARPTDDGSPSVTKTGELVGTPRYMSPEQLSAQPLTPASDIYSLGIVFLEMLVGSAPLQGNRWSDQFERMMTGHVFSFPELQRIGPELMEIINRMTAGHVTERYRSVEAISTALRPDHGAEDRADAAETARPRTAMMIVLGSVVLIAFGVFWNTKAGDESPLTKRAPTAVSNVLIEAKQPIESSDVDPPPPNEGDAVLEAVAGARRPMHHSARAAALISSGGSEGCLLEEPLHELLGPRFDTHRFLGYAPSTYRADLRPLPLLIFLPRDPDISTGLDKFLNPDREFEKLMPHRHAFMKSTKLDELAEQKGFVIFIPRVRKQWGWEDSAPSVALQVEELQRLLCFDTTRVFVLGDHKGGGLALNLAGEPWVRAIGVYATGIPDNVAHVWKVGRKPTIWVAPRDSLQVPINGRSCLPDYSPMPFVDIEGTIREANGCRDKGSVDGHCTDYRCDVPFRSCRVPGGYGWPGAIDVVDRKPCPNEPPPGRFPVEDSIWEFFESAPTTL